VVGAGVGPGPSEVELRLAGLSVRHISASDSGWSHRRVGAASRTAGADARQSFLTGVFFLRVGLALCEGCDLLLFFARTAVSAPLRRRALPRRHPYAPIQHPTSNVRAQRRPQYLDAPISTQPTNPLSSTPTLLHSQPLRPHVAQAIRVYNNMLIQNYKQITRFSLLGLILNSFHLCLWRVAHQRAPNQPPTFSDVRGEPSASPIAQARPQRTGTGAASKQHKHALRKCCAASTHTPDSITTLRSIASAASSCHSVIAICLCLCALAIRLHSCLAFLQLHSL